jgi:LL-diaminopimelate aminotransferase
MGVVNAGDLVLTANPGYPGYRANILLAGAEPFDVPILERNQYLPDLDKIPEDACQRAKVFFLNYPNNPTGACANKEFFIKLVDWAKKYRIIIVNDNPYSEFVFPGEHRLSLLEIPGAKDIGIEFNSLSKSFNMTGWRIGMVVGNQGIIEAMSRYQENVSSGVFNAIQLASIKALDEGDEDIDHMVEIYSRRRELALESLEKMGISITPGMGTFYLWAPVPNDLTSEEFSSWLLEEAHVLVTAGTAYGGYGEGYFRISLTVPDDRLVEALGRIRKVLKDKGAF